MTDIEQLEQELYADLFKILSTYNPCSVRLERRRNPRQGIVTFLPTGDAGWMLDRTEKVALIEIAEKEKTTELIVKLSDIDFLGTGDNL